jgi:4-azaleucine resistance transporter AzlC
MTPPPPPHDDAPRFTAAGIRAGFLRTVPVAAGVAVFGVVFGLVAGQKGLSLLETGLMSALVFAGASQMIALELWASPVPVAALTLAALVVNLRYLVMTAALVPALGGVGPARAYGSLFFTADENWAVAVAEIRRGNRDAGFFLGTGLALYLFWLSATVLGRAFGSAVPEPARYGLDVVGPLVFVALIAGLWSGRRDLLPWAVSAGTALAAALAVDWTWALIAGGLAGSLAGAWRDVR